MTWITHGQFRHAYADCWCQNPGSVKVCACHDEDRNLPNERTVEKYGLTRPDPAVAVRVEPEYYDLRDLIPADHDFGEVTSSGGIRLPKISGGLNGE